MRGRGDRERGGGEGEREGRDMEKRRGERLIYERPYLAGDVKCHTDDHQRGLR